MAKEKERGPKGGMKHQPGRGHDRKSGLRKTRRFQRLAAKKRQDLQEQARREWEIWDRMTDDQKHLRPELSQPSLGLMMQTKLRPATKRSFSGPWDEIQYLYQKLVYWYYEKSNPKRASAFCPRLHILLKRHASKHEGILGEECWSLMNEIQANYRAAIRYRENEIELIRRLWEISKDTPAEEFVLEGYGMDALCDRIELLAILYHDIGDLDHAIALLAESRQLSETAGILFEGKDLLQDYLEERNPQLAKFLQAQMV